VGRTIRASLVVGVALIVAGLVAGCSAATGTGGAKALEAHAWKVSKLAGAAYTGNANITAEFSAGKVLGNAGVNRYNGTYTTTADKITIDPGQMTLMAGTPEAMNAEQEYVSALKSAATFSADDTSLKLMDSSGAVTVEYAVDTPAALVGTEWTLTMYNNGTGAIQSVEASSDANAVFGADGAVAGRGGVNRYSAKYTTSGADLKIETVIATKMAGPEPLMKQEAAYFAALEKVATYKIEGRRLTLRDASGAAMADYEAK
jgi:copper homeostasis protein (lipoprotein)